MGESLSHRPMMTLPDWLSFWGHTTPDAIALLAPGRPPLTYRQLARHCSTVVQRLRSLGLGRTDHVALVLPEGAEMATALLAVTAGAVAAPLNRAYQRAEYEFYLTDLEAKALIVQRGETCSVREVAQSRGMPILELSPLTQQAAGLFTLRAGEPIPGEAVVAPQPDDLALLLHTSGTTSRPKLVPLTHGNLCAAARHIQTTLQLTPQDRCLNVMPLFHIHGIVGALLSSLLAGAQVVCPAGFDATSFFAWLQEFQPTWYTAVPTIHQAIVAQVQAHPDLLPPCPLRFVRSSSASLPPVVLQQLESLLHVPVIESYGMTEAAHQMASNPLPPGQRKVGSVGPAAGPDIAIMDEAGQVLPPGQVGEVVIRGANVMQGYRHDPLAHSTAFTAGWLRTGDQGYVDADGYLFLTGRLKELINRGGEKIAPREVEEALLEHPDVAQAVTFAVPHATLGEDVAAAVVLRVPASTTPALLRGYLASRLAAFKVPSQVVVVETLPQGPTGKVQRIGLAAQLARQLQSPSVAPRPGLQQMIADIYAEILQVEAVGGEDNFFALGGDSLQATRVLTRLRERTAYAITPALLFTHPTVADLAMAIADSPPVPQHPPVVLDQQRHTGPLSAIQAALWFLDQLDPGNPGYNRPMCWHWRGPLDAALLERGLHEIVRRHTVLRSHFSATDGHPCQHVAALQPFALAVVDLSHLAPLDRAEAAQQRLREEAWRPFDLAHDLLIRAHLIHLDSQSHWLLVTTHHIVSDGWSTEILWHELLTFYTAFAAGQAAPLAELPLQYLEVVSWQRSAVAEATWAAHLDYWRRQLAGGFAVLHLPTDRPYTTGTRRRGACQLGVLPTELSERLKTFSRQENVTVFMTLLTAFKILLHVYTGQEDILVGTPFSGRSSSPSEVLIGCFINTLPLRTRLLGNPGLRTLLERVRCTVLEAQAHQDVPFDQMVTALQLQRDSKRLGFYQVLFQLRNYPRQSQQPAGCVVQEHRLPWDVALRDLYMDIREEANGFCCHLDYDATLFEAATITQMLEHFRVLLEHLVAHPEQRLSDVSNLRITPVQSHAIADNKSQSPPPHDQSHCAVQPLTCFLMGQTSLAVECAELLHQAGHTIQGVMSDSPELCHWATQHQVPIYHDLHEVQALLTQHPCDYLFSMMNLQILPPALLALPRQCAINYHDAPLPRYAGMHAPTWALLHGETRYGVTWHVMTPEVDAGDILAQRFFDITPADTSLSLNLQCHAAALAAFQGLLPALAQRSYRRTPQDLSQRTYFSRHARPPGAAILAWQQPAEALDVLCRALSFGPYDNPLACPKIHIHGEVFMVASHTLRPSNMPAPAGTIRALDQHGITIATATTDIIITALRTLDGAPIALEALARQHHLTVGTQLQESEPGFTAALTQMERRLARHEAFWRARLATAQAVQLPYSTRSTTTTTLRNLLPVTLTRTSKRAHTLRTSPEQLLMTVIAIYLYRITSLPTFDIGFTSAALHQCLQGLAPLVTQIFAQSVPFRVSLEPEWSWPQVYAAVEREIALCQTHLTYARDLLVRAPELAVLAGFTPALAVLFAPLPEADADAAHMTFTLAYNPQEIDIPTLERMVGHLQVLLDAVLANPTQRIADLPLLTATERQQILVAWNATARTYPRASGVHQLFAEQAARSPDAVAVLSEATSLTYRQLNQRANQLAHYLRQLGVGPESLVGLCVERSPAMLIGMLGILKAGGAYVPLDPLYPVERLAFMLDDMQASVLLTSAQFLATHGDNATPLSRRMAHLPVIALDTDWDKIGQESVADPVNTTTAENLAYVIYTSGSTGRPKGVEIAHAALTNFATFAAEAFALQPTDRVLQFAAMSFDTAVEEIFPCLLSGATLVLRTAAMLGSLTAFLQHCHDWRISVWDLPTAYWHELTAWLAQHALPVPAALRLVIIGGEQALPERLRQWRTSVGDTVRLLNTYGPTETTVVATMWEASGANQSQPSLATVPIGQAIANVQTYVVDAQLHPVPVGVPGELCLGGAGLARGYLRQAALTAEKFIMQAVDGQVRQRLYRTGDLVRFLPDGNLAFLGRLDEQVKIRGFRIELGEIEAVLTQHPAVRETAVLARAESAGDTRLVAYVVTAGPALSVRALRSFLLLHLPEYMVPAVFVFLEALPRLPNGKIARQALPAPTSPLAACTDSYESPHTPTEQLLAQIWTEVLHVERVGRHDNFFDLGGHSLSATIVISRINHRCQIEMPLLAIFQGQTLADMACLLDEQIAQQRRAASEASVAHADEGVDHIVSLLAAMPEEEVQHILAEVQHKNSSPWAQDGLSQTAGGTST